MKRLNEEPLGDIKSPLLIKFTLDDPGMGSVNNRTTNSSLLCYLGTPINHTIKLYILALHMQADSSHTLTCVH